MMITHRCKGSKQSTCRPEQYPKGDDVLSGEPVSQVAKEGGEEHVANNEGRLQQPSMSVVHTLPVMVDGEPTSLLVLQKTQDS